MSAMARPSKRTPECEARLLDALRAGNTRKAACHYAGIGVQTLDDWRDRFRDFRDAIEKAEGDAEVRMVAQIAQAAQTGTWQAAAWWLERRRPDDYARRERIEQDITTRAPMVVTVAFDKPLSDMTDPAEQPLELDDDRLQPAAGGRDISK
jgi:hypothetical protein